MPQCKCSRPIQSGRMCRECARDDHYEQRDRQIEWGECPECGGLSSSDQVRCADCRRPDG